MTDPRLTPERILDTAEDVLRRFGPDKATVVDVARALGVSHGSVYRHFPSKAALHDAVAERWLARVSTPLAAVAESDAPALTRLRQWLDLLVTTKRTWAREDPELFANYVKLAAAAREVIGAHVETLTAQLARIIAGGVREGVFSVSDPLTMARAVLHATARFHDPLHAGAWSDPAIDDAYAGVWALIIRGLGAASA